jgi:hypothetical protein
LLVDQVKQTHPEEQDAETTRRIQHLLYAPQPENVGSWLAWYRYFRQGGMSVGEALFNAWRTAQPVRRRLSRAWWWVKIPFLAVYEASRDTWREYRDRKSSGGSGE